MQAGGKTRLITIGSGNTHTSMSFIKNWVRYNKTAARLGISSIKESKKLTFTCQKHFGCRPII